MVGSLVFAFPLALFIRLHTQQRALLDKLDGTHGRSRLVLLALSAPFLLVLLALLAGGRDGNLLPTPLPPMLREPATSAKPLVHPGLSQVLRYAFQRLTLLLLGKPWSAVTSDGSLGRLRLLRIWGLFLFLRIVALSRATLALALALCPGVRLAFRLSTPHLFFREELLMGQTDLLYGHDQGIVLLRLTSLDLGQLLPELVGEAVLQDLSPGHPGDADLPVQAFELVDVLQNVVAVLRLEQLFIVDLPFEIDLESLVHC